MLGPFLFPFSLPFPSLPLFVTSMYVKLHTWVHSHIFLRNVFSVVSPTFSFSFVVSIMIVEDVLPGWHQRMREGTRSARLPSYIRRCLGEIRLGWSPSPDCANQGRKALGPGSDHHLRSVTVGSRHQPRHYSKYHRQMELGETDDGDRKGTVTIILIRYSGDRQRRESSSG